MDSLNMLLKVASLAPAVLLVWGCASDPAAGMESDRAEANRSKHVIDLSSDEAELASAFNESSQNVQLVLILSPT